MIINIDNINQLYMTSETHENMSSLIENAEVDSSENICANIESVCNDILKLCESSDLSDNTSSLKLLKDKSSQVSELARKLALEFNNNKADT
jgi:ribosomal protein L17